MIWCQDVVIWCQDIVIWCQDNVIWYQDVRISWYDVTVRITWYDVRITWSTLISHRRDNSPLSITINFKQISFEFLQMNFVLFEQFAQDLATLNESTKVSLFTEDILEEHWSHKTLQFLFTYCLFTTFRPFDLGLFRWLWHFWNCHLGKMTISEPNRNSKAAIPCFSS